jgi:hypothetical protein
MYIIRPVSIPIATVPADTSSSQYDAAQDRVVLMHRSTSSPNSGSEHENCLFELFMQLDASAQHSDNDRKCSCIDAMHTFVSLALATSS